MSKEAHILIEAARKYIGCDFRHHFDPHNLCDNGKVTVDNCMEHGLGQDRQFDCSGLVAAAIRDVLGITNSELPRYFRHARQFTELEERTPSLEGDIAIFYPANSPNLHMGILVAEKTVLHASGRSKKVEKGEVAGKFRRIGIVPSEKALDAFSLAGNYAKTTD